MNESSYMKTTFDQINIEKIKKFSSDLKLSPLYIIFDETQDEMHRYILNILIGKCSELKANKAFLIKTIELNKTNSENINIEILKTLNNLFCNDVNLFEN
jgi:tRNA(Ser,Leu) C12 N-acetylase TAN1